MHSRNFYGQSQKTIDKLGENVCNIYHKVLLLLIYKEPLRIEEQGTKSLIEKCEKNINNALKRFKNPPETYEKVFKLQSQLEKYKRLQQDWRYRSSQTLLVGMQTDTPPSVGELGNA